MHDPMTQVCSNRLFTLWHVDPERDGSDDSCDWFGGRKMTDKQKVVRDKIAGDLAFLWHRNPPYERFGWFMPDDGSPNYSTHAIVLWMFRTAVNHHFGHWSRRADRFLRRYLADILFFAENSCDSLCDSIEQKHGPRDGDHKKQARRFATVVYSWILRAERPWWRHPRWHVHHWRFQVHPLQALRRRLFSRCEVCGRGFGGETPVGLFWDPPPRRWFEWFRSERGLVHANCRARQERHPSTSFPQGNGSVARSEEKL